MVWGKCVCGVVCVVCGEVCGEYVEKSVRVKVIGKDMRV